MQFSSGDPVGEDMGNRSLVPLHALSEKLRDEMVARLSELGQRKIGRLNFHFATVKFNALQNEADEFAEFVEKHRFREKRNYDISHKELPETWSDHKHIHISYPNIMKAIAMGLRLMKRIDRVMLGPVSTYLWCELRKKRYEFIHPPRVVYMLLPYLHLTSEDRHKIIEEEEREGRPVWSEMETLVNGRPAKIRIAKQWGIIDKLSIKFIDSDAQSGDSDA